MKAQPKPFYVLAGPPGAGKTTLLAALAPHIQTVPEYARRVLAEERQTGGRATGEQDPALFVERMLQVAVTDYDRASGPTVFDRGLPDLLAFCAHYGLADAHVREEIRARPYRSPVFFLPAWSEIYCQDDERKLDFEGADAFGALIAEAYRTSGYDLIHVPKASLEDRCAFVLAHISR